jgi:poly [ADP-ribose] polymerase
MSVIEVSKSSRASCRKCKEKIEKDTLRFGVESDMQYGDEPSYRWYHLECGAAVEPAQLEKLLKTYSGEIPNREEIEKAIAAGKKKKKPEFPYAEVAPSGRSKCMQCSETIEKGQLRVAVEREVDTGTFVTKGAGYLHVGCAVEHTGDEELPQKVLANSHQLEEEQRAELEAAFGDAGE